ncbi:Prolyl-tRNA synthetase [Liberibacter crescens BT-1]|uniref:Proline--tRNA ligase n=1 Tax=Liberibacter crescens (strain BT-1) TaxID=1215343 RepID=L0EV43_LIBCB|nr:proline--tRNA ligase [Liberibacter crescens]AGA64266.1 Prolyl-tRNA synthetase [Liberibacter crescens BT-1]AMC12500.1 proline--tRNA ligase [Liberibacter crescens]
MRMSRYFLPILNENPRDAELISHKLMLRTGMIHQHSRGIYSFLPLGKKVLDKVNSIIRREQNRSGAIELLMPTLQSAELWQESGRYDSYGKEMLRFCDRHNRAMLYGPTNEEMITDIFRSYIKSYKDLPLNLYHIQSKFRDEIRPRFGVMRAREFLMKDAYSFDLTRESAEHSYHKMFVSYLRIFDCMGLKPITLRASTGPIGGDLSHEFIILAETGETEVFCCKDFLDFSIPVAQTDFDDVVALKNIVNQWTSLYASTSDLHDESIFNAIPEKKRLITHGIEVGHIFYFGTKYSEAMNARVKGVDGKEHFVHMGSYGIGAMRIIPAIIETSYDNNGIIWPPSVSPFDISLINLKVKDKECNEACEKIYNTLSKFGKEVLLDDKEDGAGAKFATADLLGFPYQIIVGSQFNMYKEVELKNRKTSFREKMSVEAVINYLTQKINNEEA